MKLATILAVFALGALAACAGAPEETLATSYGVAVPPANSQPAASADEAGEESASATIAAARAAAAAERAESEAPGPGALAFSPAPEDEEAADATAPEEENAQVAAVPREDAAANEAPVVLTKPPSEPAPEDTAALPEQPAEQPATPPEAQPYRVQLAAYRQPAGAEGAWDVLLRAYPDLLTGLTKTIRRADLGPTIGVLHQLRVGPFVGEAQARNLCQTLKFRGADCFIVTPRRQAREGG